MTRLQTAWANVTAKHAEQVHAAGAGHVEAVAVLTAKNEELTQQIAADEATVAEMEAAAATV